MNFLSLTALLLFASSFVASARAERPMRGTYEVPMDEETLKQAAVYPVHFKLDGYETNPNKLDFPLPEELVGTALTVHMVKTGDAPDSWRGDNVSGDCGQEGRDVVCNVKFSSLPFDAVAAAKIIKDKYTDPVEAEMRTLVTTNFQAQSEPKGILRYRLRGRDRDR